MLSRSAGWSIVRGFWLMGVAVAASACASGTGPSRPPVVAPAAASEAVLPFEGEWMLTSFQLADGSSRRVVGFVRFDRFSNMSLHAELAPDEPVARPPRTVIADFTARVRASNGILELAGVSLGVGAERLILDAVAMDEWRHYELVGSSLRLFVRDRAGRAAATLVFERSR